jgi:hypothetical protein
LHGADLRGASLHGVIVEGASLSGAIVDRESVKELRDYFGEVEIE